MERPGNLKKEIFIWRKKLIAWGMMLLGVHLFAAAAPAQDYPTKAVEIVCPWTPGSSMDLTARLVAEIAPKYLGQPMVVNNKPGASGSIAAVEVIKSAPDGYKVLIGTNLFFALTVKTQKIAFDPQVLVPIANVMEYKIGIIVKGDAPWKSFQEILDYARKNPGKLRWAHPGRGVIHHLDGMAVFKKANVKTIDVPYKGSPEMLAGLLGGHVDAATLPYGAIKDHVRAGKVRYLITFSKQRYSDLPNVPCAVELGFPEAGALITYTGFYAHKDTSDGIKKTLSNVFKKVCDDPNYKKGMEKIGEEPRFGNPDFMKEAIRTSEEVGVPLLKELGLYVQP